MRLEGALEKTSPGMYISTLWWLLVAWKNTKVVRKHYPGCGNREQHDKIMRENLHPACRQSEYYLRSTGGATHHSIYKSRRLKKFFSTKFLLFLCNSRIPLYHRASRGSQSIGKNSSCLVTFACQAASELHRRYRNNYPSEKGRKAYAK